MRGQKLPVIDGRRGLRREVAVYNFMMIASLGSQSGEQTNPSRVAALLHARVVAVAVEPFSAQLGIQSNYEEAGTLSTVRKFPENDVL